MVAVIVARATGDGDAAASCDESTGNAECGADGDEDAGEADWATYQAQSRQCTSHSVVSVLLYARHGIIIINPGLHTYYSRAEIYILSPDRECDRVEVLPC